MYKPAAPAGTLSLRSSSGRAALRVKSGRLRSVTAAGYSREQTLDKSIATEPCCVTLFYVGSSLSLDYECLDVRDEITIKQQPSGGGSVVIYCKLIKPRCMFSSNHTVFLILTEYGLGW